jgi:aspartate 1-decarboxylase
MMFLVSGLLTCQCRSRLTFWVYHFSTSGKYVKAFDRVSSRVTFMRKVIGGKLHGIRVTQANLNYHGSITLDPDHCEAAGIVPLEFVEIWNKNSGARISTYVILGERGSRCCILNGAAARTCQPGDELIICSSVYLPGESIAELSPAVVILDEDNNIAQSLRYSVSLDGAGRYQFAILDARGTRLKVPLRSGSAQTRKC